MKKKRKKERVVVIMSYAPSLNLRLLKFVKIKLKLCIYQLFEFISYIYIHTLASEHARERVLRFSSIFLDKN